MSDEIEVQPQFYTVPEAAKVLKVSRQAVYDYLRRGELPSALIGKRRRIKITDLDEFIERIRSTDYQPLENYNAALRKAAAS